MNFAENVLLLLALPTGMVLGGYWLAAPLSQATSGERLAVSSLAGLSCFLWSVSAVNFFHPLSGLWAGLCLWPIGLTLVLPRARAFLQHDVLAVVRHRHGLLVGLVGAVFLLGLLWPMLTFRSLVFYDGTGNHDSFFWISGAEYLKRQTYMDAPSVDAVHPFNNVVHAIIGWQPMWGRMGAEGLLGWVSSLMGVSVLKIYVCATATLFIPWIAGGFLSATTFLQRKIDRIALLALVLMQPIFVFFHGNANLPNLVGILMGTAVLIATERALRDEGDSRAWLGLLALAFHGLLCTYPEVVPFILLPGALLWLRRGWFCIRGTITKSHSQSGRQEAIWRPLVFVALAYLAGLALNPVSSVRAIHGFEASFATARADFGWSNIFRILSPTEYVPALFTLGALASADVGSAVGLLLSLALLGALGLVLWRARDRFGCVAMLSGTLLLMVYTGLTDFSYGWQKSIQFGGVFCSALLPLALGDLRRFATQVRSRPRFVIPFAAIGIAAFLLYATGRNMESGYKGARRKNLTTDFYSLREYTRTHLRNSPILIEPASFDMAFFHGMWSTYFLSDSRVYFSARGFQNGGYLRESVVTEGKGQIPPVAGYLVSRRWAETFDANSPRLFFGETVALLSRTNRVITLNGLSPESGVPHAATDRNTIELIPSTPSELSWELTPWTRHFTTPTRWHVTCRADGEPGFSADISGPPPWKFAVPLVAEKINRIEFTATPAVEKGESPFVVNSLAIENRP